MHLRPANSLPGGEGSEPAMTAEPDRRGGDPVIDVGDPVIDVLGELAKR